MEDTAYLVVFVNTSDPTNPRLTRAGIFSASANNLTKLGSEHGLDVTYARGETYEKAELALWRIKDAYAGVYDWAFNLLPERERQARELRAKGSR
jgi:hypothetical protein